MILLPYNHCCSSRWQNANPPPIVEPCPMRLKSAIAMVCTPLRSLYMYVDLTGWLVNVRCLSRQILDPHFFCSPVPCFEIFGPPGPYMMRTPMHVINYSRDSEGSGTGFHSGYKWLAGLVSRVGMAGLVYNILVSVCVILMRHVDLCITTWVHIVTHLQTSNQGNILIKPHPGIVYNCGTRVFNWYWIR